MALAQRLEDLAAAPLCEGGGQVAVLRALRLFPALADALEEVKEREDLDEATAVVDEAAPSESARRAAINTQSTYKDQISSSSSTALAACAEALPLLADSLASLEFDPPVLGALAVALLRLLPRDLPSAAAFPLDRALLNALVLIPMLF